MIKKIIPAALILLACNGHSASAQLAKQKDATLEQISKHINALIQKDTEEAKAEVLNEAQALAASKDENFVNFASRIYAYLGNDEQSDKLDKAIIKKFPKGIKARQQAYDDIFNDETTLRATEIETKYQQWLKKFPASLYDAKNQGIYDQALSSLAHLYFKENNTEKANAYIAQLESKENYPIYASSLVNMLVKNKQYKEALPIAAKAFEKAEQAYYSSDTKLKNSNIAGRYNSLAPAYAQVLAAEKQVEKSIEVLEKYFANSSYARSVAAWVLIQAQNYQQTGRDLDAFNLLNNFLISHSSSEEIVSTIQPLYEKLNNHKGDFNSYLAKTKVAAKEAMTAKYKSEMIKKEAPNFSLVNMQGKTVSLADLKGKVIVLDFWATWCGPCKISFPGMQAAVNKYKEDKEVEFLFIDTWQREKNYKELVEKFIADNKYTFHVLYDEMHDRAKATTTAYGVQGIPHKVVIDKEGFIRFESSGGTDDVQKIVNELETKIELARKG